MFYFRIFALCILVLSLNVIGRADDLGALDAEFNAHLAANDVEAAHALGERYYATSKSQDNHQTAGRVAYAMAGLASLRDESDDTPVWFDRCAKHYEILGAAAQQVDCIHKAALSYKAAGKFGTTRDRLKSAERALKKAHASETIVAALIYADLAESYIPPQFETGASADADRQRVLDYTQAARAILSSNRQAGHILYATLLAREATAFEDLKRYEEAVPPMQQAMEMIADKPEHKRLYDDLRRRYAMIYAQTPGENGDENRFTVKMEDGREVSLKVKRRTRVIYPRAENTTSEYALGTVLITLDPNGDVAEAEIVESKPTPAFGAAVEKAVKRWSFYPEDGTPPESIPPFRYGVSFDVVRRR